MKDTGSQQELRLTYGAVVANPSLTRLLKLETRALIENATGEPTGTLGSPVKQVEYGYDASGRLTSVTTDLTPSNTTDSAVYVTTYTYDGASTRLRLIAGKSE